MRNSILTIFIILFLDQALKLWIKSSYELNDLIGQWWIVKIHFIENPGMAFGWSFGNLWGKVALSLFRIVAVVFLGFYIKRLIKTNAHKIYIFCISMIFAGAFGNIIDSAFYGLMFDSGTVWNSDINNWIDYNGISNMNFEGYGGFLQGCVVDMIHLDFNWPNWMPFGLGGNEVFPPVFNIADFSISTGVVLIILFYKRIVRDEDFQFYNQKKEVQDLDV